MFLNLYKKAIKIFRNKESFFQILWFSIIWCIGTGINLGITYSLTEYLWFWYILSNIIGQVIGITNNFFMNKYFNFKKTTWSTKRQFLSSFSIYWISILISLVMIYLLTDHLHIRYIYSIIIIIPIVTVINFTLHKLIVFKH